MVAYEQVCTIVLIQSRLSHSGSLKCEYNEHECLQVPSEWKQVFKTRENRKQENKTNNENDIEYEKEEAG